MKWFIFSILLLLLFCAPAIAQENRKYEKKIERYQSKWQGLIPTHSKLQYAGSMGLISAGVGWDYGKRDQWETDAILGFVPKHSNNKAKFVFTVKQNFIPWKRPWGNKGFVFEPLTTGLYINTITGKNFWNKEPGKYPNNYYNVSTKIRFYAFAGERITYKIPSEKRWYFKEITFFYEISTCDLYVASAAQNSYLKPHDYLGLSFGLKFHFF